MYNIISGEEKVIKLVQEYASLSNEELAGLNSEEIAKRAEARQLRLMPSYHQSMYNYCVENGKKYLVYNTLYNSLVSIDKKEYEAYSGETGCSEETERHFVGTGLWIPAEIDERRAYLHYAADMHKNNRGDVVIILTTTLQCNARCAYCYEAGVKQHSFDVSHIDDLIRFIVGLEREKHVHITWFGGEPLMNLPFIDEVVRKLGEAGIPFYTTMITNGSLITENIVKEKFFSWKLKHVQITLDGTAEEYAKIKNYVTPDIGKFGDIVRNIGFIAKSGVPVDVRVNIDKNNIADVMTLFLFLENSFAESKMVSYYPAYINGSAHDVEKEEREEILYRLMKSLTCPAKLIKVQKFYMEPLSAACHHADPKAYAIDVDGNVYTCEHDVGCAEKRIGDVMSGLYEKDKRLEPPKLSEECKKCVFLPKCFGGCESDRLQKNNPCMIIKYLIPAYMRLMLEL